MNVSAVISEFNPFHNGHRYLLAQLRTEGATHIVAIMGGAFLQRGEPALLTKQARAQCALLGGADLVLELPAVWATASAQRFAFGGVSIANALGCVDRLAFGSECGDILKLCAVADEIYSPGFSSKIKETLAHGKSYARAVSEAALCLPEELRVILRHPNNTLAIEYIRALRMLSSRIEPFTIKRAGARHDSTAPLGGIASASHLRELVRAHKEKTAFALMPDNCAAVAAQEIALGRFADMARMERAVLYRLRCMSRGELSLLPDVTEGLENRLYAAVQKGRSLDEIIFSVKTKRYTHARIRRIIMSAFLGITAEMQKQAQPPYLRVLGLNARGAQILKEAKKTAALPVITKITDSLPLLGENQKELLSLDIKAADCQSLAFETIPACGEDYTKSPVRLL